MRSISYKPAFSALEIIFGLIGPAIIVISLVVPIPDMKIGTLWLNVPDGVANAVLTAVGVLVTLMTVHNLLVKRAARAHGAAIVLDETALTYTQVRGYTGVLATIPYADIRKVAVTTGDDNVVKLVTPSARPAKVTFDADNMTSTADFHTLIDVLKHKADNASFTAKEIQA
ncbi:hypothetical protein AB4Y63_11290 [Leifsonia sp. YAF41]|uniref:hypothetical protein n=1 Tax=Leifsonia sp. YAF41 TaxID=3233086 RepID=UPI003F95CE00